MAEDLRPLSVAAQMQLALAHEVRALVDAGAGTLEMFESLARAHPNYQLTLDSVERLARQVADKRPIAKRYLHSKSFDMARNVVENGKPSDHVRALESMGDVMESQANAAGGVTIIVGGDAHIALLHGPRTE
jgi:methionine synthase II (cobalamin-independent)